VLFASSPFYLILLFPELSAMSSNSRTMRVLAPAEKWRLATEKKRTENRKLRLAKLRKKQQTKEKRINSPLTMKKPVPRKKYFQPPTRPNEFRKSPVSSSDDDLPYDYWDARNYDTSEH
jgi:hypothetical protein